jgi:16S rRNA (guanine527-N7)-methyltransferase
VTSSSLAKGAEAFGVSLGEAQLAAFERYRQELLSWNERINLTAITDPTEVEVRHFLDSLSCLLGMDNLLRSRSTPSIIDVGAGPGFPGLPIKLARPAVRLVLVDSVAKKAAFLRHVVASLGLSEVTVLTGRAEDLARSAVHRERYDAAVGRAVASLPVLVELCLPFVRIGGRLVAPRRGDLLQEQQDAETAVALLGGRFRAPIPVELGHGRDGYGLVVVAKERPTPARFPRRAGVPAKRPLT